MSKPLEIELGPDFDGPPVLAYGADGKAGLCLADRGKATLEILGDDLADPQARERIRVEADRMIERAGDPPRYSAHDLHPDFFTSRLARAGGLIPIPVQHHHAHMAAVMAEYRLAGPVIGVTFDGMGLGDDGGLWGGEFLVGDLAGFVRVGHLQATPQPGGDASAREPWRMALSLLFSVLGQEWEAPAAGIVSRQGKARCETVIRAMKQGVNSPVTTSAGRLFEGAAAIMGLGDINTSPALVAISFERAATGQTPAPMRFDVRKTDQTWTADPTPIVRALAQAVREGADPGPYAAGFHLALAEAVGEVCARVREERKLDAVVLAGGVFMNRLLRDRTLDALRRLGFQAYVGGAVPPHDGSLALGQAVVAMTKIKAGRI